MIALNIGCGNHKIEFEGYDTKSVDIRPEVQPDVVADLNALPFEKNSIDLIYSSHVLEHVGRTELYQVFRHWRSLLTENGRLITIIPDLTVAAIELLSGTTNPSTWDILFGAQNYKENFHKSGFTAPALQAFLEKYGFKVISIICANREIHCEAIKCGEFNDKY